MAKGGFKTVEESSNSKEERLYKKYYEKERPNYEDWVTHLFELTAKNITESEEISDEKKNYMWFALLFAMDSHIKSKIRANWEKGLPKSRESLDNPYLKRTPKEFGYNFKDFFSSMSTRLCNVLKDSFPDRIICEIKSAEFLSARSAGKKSWFELCSITGNDELC